MKTEHMILLGVGAYLLYNATRSPGGTYYGGVYYPPGTYPTQQEPGALDVIGNILNALGNLLGNISTPPPEESQTL